MLADGIDEVIADSECIVIANRDPLFADVLNRVRPDQAVVDLVRIDTAVESGGRYVGLGW
jgi:hypothetical protein